MCMWIEEFAKTPVGWVQGMKGGVYIYIDRRVR